MLLSGARVVVLGLGVSGQAAAQFLLRRGARVVASDVRVHHGKPGLADALIDSGAEVIIGPQDAELFRDADLVVVSPGVPSMAELDAVARSGVPVISEIELASWYIHAPIVAITGTNGKSTVTTLIGEMCASRGRRVFVGGNLGTPGIVAVGTPAGEADGLVILELSSFQLERIQTFRPNIAALLNVSPDHLDRYSSYDDYRAAKARVFENQTESDIAVAAAADLECIQIASASRGNLLLYGPPDGEVHIEGDVLRDRSNGLEVPIDKLGIKGAQSLSNMACACLISRQLGISPDEIARALTTFKGLPHRMQFVAEIDGVQYYDDSKATNVGAAVSAIAGVGKGTERVVLVLGGRDKGASYGPLADSIKTRARAAVLIGEATPLLKDALAPTGIPIECADSMEGAVNSARAMARVGDVVLLAPACSSFDMFESYAERGNAFQAAVRALESSQKREAC